jgi:acyl-CoA synthetase (AMP-forming)/AMP-acid ligase II
MMEQANKNRDRPFVELPGTCCTLSFAEVGNLVDSIATQLANNGLMRGDRAVIILPNGLEAIVAMLAVMAAGAVAVPVNPGLTVEESARIIVLAKAHLVLTDTAHKNKVEQTVGTHMSICPLSSNMIALDLALFSTSVAKSVLNSRIPRHETGADDPALILFTSGTTGHPKGVVLSHDNLLTNARYVSTAHRLTSDDTVLCVLPIYHINGFVVTLLTPLLSSSRVVMPHRFSVGNFWQWVHAYQATWFSAVPTIFSILLSHQDPPRDYPASLRFARSASAPLPVAVLEEFEHRFRIPVIETYGISEAACQVTANPLPPLPHKPGSSGIPVGNELNVVDKAGTPLQPGEIGEVILKGKNIFTGYLDNSSADREALRDSWFHTGDLGFLDQDGYLFLTGRKKELINRSGEKISPREVEEVIHRLPEVESVGVVGIPHQLYGEEVAAFITLRPGKKLEPECIREYCRKYLASFKVPREILFIDDLPKGPSGKIQRRRLVDIYHHVTSQQEEEKRT